MTDDPRNLQLSRVTFIDTPVDGPRWSPDGRRLLYSKYLPGCAQRQIWVLDLQGLVKRMVVSSGNAGAWSREGNRIAYIQPKPSSLEPCIGDIGGLLSVYDLATTRKVALVPMTTDRLKWIDDTILSLRGAESGLRGVTIGGVELGALGIVRVEGDVLQKLVVLQRMRDFNASSGVLSLGVNSYPSQVPPTRLTPDAQLEVTAIGIVGTPGVRIDPRGNIVRNGPWDGLWAVRKDTAFASLLIPGASEAEVAPDWSRIAFVRGDTLYLGSLTPTARASASSWWIPIGEADGLVVGDLVTIYSARKNPLNNRVLGPQGPPKATALVSRVFTDSAEIRLHEIAVQVTDSDVAVIISRYTEPLSRAVVYPELWKPLARRSPMTEGQAAAQVEPLYRVLERPLSDRALRCVQDAKQVGRAWNWAKILSSDSYIDEFYNTSCSGITKGEQLQTATRLRIPAAKDEAIRRLRRALSPSFTSQASVSDETSITALWTAGQFADPSTRDVVQSLCAKWAGLERSHPMETHLCLEVLRMLQGPTVGQGVGAPAVGQAEVSDNSADQRVFSPPVRNERVMEAYESKNSDGIDPRYYPELIGYDAGIDYAGPGDVLAVADGIIVRLVRDDSHGPEKDSGFGQTVILGHALQKGDTLYSLYAHLASLDPQLTVGQHVKKGQVLGQMGSSGSGKDSHWIRVPEVGSRCVPKNFVITLNFNSSMYCVRLHFEIKTRPVLENPAGGQPCRRRTLIGSKSGSCYAYTPGPPSQFGYLNPADVIGRMQTTAP